MPSDTKYLQLRNGIWFIRIAKPPKHWRIKGEYIHTLRTDKLKIAQQLRDKYLIPILAETKALEMAESILKLIAGADEKIKEKLQSFGGYLGDEVEELTIQQAFEKFKSFKKRTGARESTIRVYNATQMAFKRIFDYDMPMTELTTKHITEWRDKLLSLPAGWQKMKDPDSDSGSKRMSSTTVNNQLSKFRTVWDWAKTEKLFICTHDNPAKGITAGESRTTKTDRPITVEECNQLISMPFNTNIKSFDKKTWTYLPIIARYTGARMGEIAQLTTNDIKEVNGFLCISFNPDDGKTQKTRESRRIVPISDKLETLIKPLIEKSLQSFTQKPLFPNRGDSSGKVANEFSKAWNKAAKKYGKHCYFHGLRAYTITQLANAGVDQIDRMKIAGHKTKDPHAGYTKSDLQRLKKGLDSVP